MQPDYLIVLFSKYSNACQSLLELYDEHLMSTIKFVCIDNASIRKRFMEDPTLQIRQVPCVLFVYPQNKIEKFEGTNVTRWLYDKLKSYLPTPIPPPTSYTQPPQQTPQQQIPEPVKPAPIPIMEETEAVVPVEETIATQPFTAIDQLPDIEENDIVQQSIKKSTRKEKSIVERAAEMAALREGADKPAHLQMQEQQSRQFEASINGQML